MKILMRLGAFDVAVDDVSDAHRELLKSLFRAPIEPLKDGGSVDLQLAVAAGDHRSGFGATVALECTDEGGRLRFVSDVVAGDLDRTTTPARLSLWIDERNWHVKHLDLYLRIVLNAVLRRFDRIRLHASAVDFNGATSLFAGDKGVGKTTICLHLARAGGTVLGEDQIMVRRAGPASYLAAGGDGVMRLTTKTEAHFFRKVLAARAVVVAGVAKKEIQAPDYIAYEPNRETPPRRIFFPDVGQTFAIQPLTGRDALSRLAAPLLPIHRFTSDEDRRDFVAFLAGLTRQAKSYALTLTPNLDDLGRLSEFLE